MCACTYLVRVSYQVPRAGKARKRMTSPMEGYTVNTMKDKKVNNLKGKLIKPEIQKRKSTHIEPREAAVR